MGRNSASFFLLDTFDETSITALTFSSPHVVVIQFPKTAMEKIMNEEILIELGEVSEKTMGLPAGCIFEGPTLPNRQKQVGEDCPS